ncbi:hypothetical protein [Bowmanella dokdonensis]|uniref:Uncharacterized protein n=1 Tax=Bowmanella dokdonensis TaxID=751969 RepID=A0A939DQZ3_9ALTE|nr:hypothetical protein [Bowmanella dokdonensis]MBN7827124.1 hypothetical protein [Bowmanella dokdonensis]
MSEIVKETDKLYQDANPAASAVSGTKPTGLKIIFEAIRLNQIHIERTLQRHAAQSNMSIQQRDKI